jgi:hypothetical protein
MLERSEVANFEKKTVNASKNTILFSKYLKESARFHPFRDSAVKKSGGLWLISQDHQPPPKYGAEAPVL